MPFDYEPAPQEFDWTVQWKNWLSRLRESIVRLLPSAADLDGYIKGFVPTRDSATKLTFSAGTIITSDRVYRTTASLQKILGTTWAEGNAAGGEFSGATIGNTDDYYAIAISKNSNPQTVDIGFDDNASGTNKPAGWTVLKEVFRGMTNSSGEIDAKTVTETAGGGLYAEYDVSIQEFSDNSTGTSRVDKTLSAVPPDTISDMVWTHMESGTVTSSSELLITREGQTNTAPGPSNYSLRIRPVDSSDEHANSSRWRVKTNASRVVCYRASASASTLFVQANCIGYILERQ